MLTTAQRTRRIVSEFGSLTIPIDRVSDTDDLYAAGMTSHAGVNVMLALEAEFGVEFPDEVLKASLFQSIENIVTAITGLQPRPG